MGHNQSILCAAYCTQLSNVPEVKNTQLKAANNKDLNFDNPVCYSQCRKLGTTVQSCTHCSIVHDPGCET